MLNVRNKKGTVSSAACLMGAAVLFILFLAVKRELEASEMSFGAVIKEDAARELEQSAGELFLPISNVVQQAEDNKALMMEKQLSEILPYYGLCRWIQAESPVEEVKENYLSLEEL